MTPSQIDNAETQFSKTLTDSNGTKFTAQQTIDIGGGHCITPLKSQYNTYFYASVTKKSQIFLHFTVGSVKGDIATLSKHGTTSDHVSVSYLVDRQGHVYRMFDDKYWSYHLGSSAIGGNSAMSKQSIGIEISNYGPLKLSDGKYVDAYGKVYTDDGNQVKRTSYRGYDFYAKMTDNQMDAVCYLLHHLCGTHDIPDTFKEDMGTVFGNASDALAFRGILCHTDVRKDKYDWPPEMANEIRARYNELFHAPEPEPEPESKPEPVQEQAMIEEHCADPARTTPVKKSEPEKKKSAPKSTNSGIIGILIDIALSLFGTKK